MLKRKIIWTKPSWLQVRFVNLPGCKQSSDWRNVYSGVRCVQGPSIPGCSSFQRLHYIHYCEKIESNLRVFFVVGCIPQYPTCFFLISKGGTPKMTGLPKPELLGCCFWQICFFGMMSGWFFQVFETMWNKSIKVISSRVRTPLQKTLEIKSCHVARIEFFIAPDCFEMTSQEYIFSHIDMPNRTCLMLVYHYP